MPAPSTGSPANVLTLNAMFGEDVTLPDGTTIVGKFSVRTDDYGIEPGSQIREFPVLDVHDSVKGTLALEQTVVIRGVNYFVVTMNADSEGWIRCGLTRA